MTPKPRILMLAHRFPYPPNRGDRIRSYHLLRYLSQFYDVSLACPTHEPIHDEHHEHVRSLTSNLAVKPIGKWTKYHRAATSVARGRSLSEGFFSAPSLSRSIRQWHAKQPFDAALIVCSSMYRYRRTAGLHSIPTVVDLVDVDSQKWFQLGRETKGVMRHVYRLENVRTSKVEKHIADTADAIVLTSHEEVQLFRQSCISPAAAYGIGNGVDTQYFRPNPLRLQRTAGQVKLVFTGVMDYQPNVEGMLWFCRHVLPLVSSAVDVSLKIVGRNPTPAVQALSSIPNVQVVGEVPDVRPYLDTADIALSPLHLARGIQNKVLEAMASGLPIVVTPQSAEGIVGLKRGQHLMVAGTVHDFAEAIVQLGHSSVVRTQMGGAARQFVEEHYSWSAQLAGFRRLLQDICTPILTAV